VLACVARLQVSHVPARDRLTTGVQAPPTLSGKAIAWNMDTPSLRHGATPGKPAVRQAHGGTIWRGRKKPGENQSPFGATTRRRAPLLSDNLSAVQTLCPHKARQPPSHGMITL
jgi:hypothetical protein